MHTERKHRRIPLSKDDGVYCIVIRSKSGGKPIALPVKDFSESGFSFTIDPSLKNDFLEGEKIFLKAITGSRNLTFREPVELRIRWQKDNGNNNFQDIGCEIFNITTRARMQLVDFIFSEDRFRGLNGYCRTTDGRQEINAIQEATAGKDKQQHRRLKTVFIFGAPRLDGNTAKVTGWVEEDLMDSGHHIERFDLFSKNVNGCLGCLQCNTNSTEASCAQKDDATEIIHRIVASDLVIYASPLYHWGFSAQMKALIDRCRCLSKGLGGPNGHTSLINGQRQALIITSAGPFENNAEQILTTFHRMLLNNKAHSAGELFVCNCSSPDALNGEIRDQAGRFANQLSGAVKAPYAILLPGVTASTV